MATQRFPLNISEKAETVIQQYTEILQGSKSSVINQMIESLPELNITNSKLAQENKSQKADLENCYKEINRLEAILEKWKKDQQTTMDFLGINKIINRAKSPVANH